MNIIELMLKEMDREAVATRKMLSRVPNDKWDWKPHQKSMTMMQLSTHLAELPDWITLAVTSDGLDFATTPYQPTTVKTNSELLEIFEKALAAGRKNLQNTSEKTLGETWTLRNGDEIYATDSKLETVRHAFCQMVHHRAQLGVYLRLLDIPLPATYGPSADEAF